jgi:hypothetical protein
MLSKSVVSIGPLGASNPCLILFCSSPVPHKPLPQPSHKTCFTVYLTSALKMEAVISSETAFSQKQKATVSTIGRFNLDINNSMI